MSDFDTGFVSLKKYKQHLKIQWDDTFSMPLNAHKQK